MSCGEVVAGCYLGVVQRGSPRRMCALIGTSVVGLGSRSVALKLGRVLAQLRRPGGRVDVQLHCVKVLKRDVGRVR